MSYSHNQRKKKNYRKNRAAIKEAGGEWVYSYLQEKHFTKNRLN